MSPTTIELARSPKVSLAPFTFRSFDDSPGPKHDEQRSADTISAHSYQDCRIALNAGVLFDAADAPVEETLYLIPKLPKLDPAGLAFANIPELAGRNVILSYNAGWRNYYHWLIQALFSAHLYAPHATDDDVFVFPSPLANRTPMLLLAGVPQERIHFLHKNHNFHADRVTIVDSCYARHVYSPSPRMRAFGETLARGLSPSKVRRLYISRRDSKNRSIANEEQVEALLRSQGFECLTLSDLSFGEQIALFRGAETVIAAHGAGLANVVFCQPGTRVIELTPSNYINPCFLKLGQVLDLQWEMYAFAAPKADRQQSISWQVDLDFLAGVL